MKKDSLVGPIELIPPMSFEVELSSMILDVPIKCSTGWVCQEGTTTTKFEAV